MKRALVLAILCVAASARAEDFWSQASEDPDRATARRNYEKAMEDGDSFAQLATSRGTGGNDMRRLLMSAIRSYVNASLARPDAPEPHYRAGLLLRNFFVTCETSPVIVLNWCQHGHPDPRDAARMADEWTAFAKLAPLDPRVDFEFMFDLAIAETQAAGGANAEDSKVRARIQAALGFYQAAMQRTLLGDTSAVRNEVLGNMAESYMMLGDLDDAIATYQQTLRGGAGDLSTTYGLAVAYDRDEQGEKARELVRAMGADQFDTFKEKIRRGDVFFVPDGEAFYYLALAEESFGDYDEAINDWQVFIDSKAHPQFAARAKANRDGLLKAQKHGKAPPPDVRVRVRER